MTPIERVIANTAMIPECGCWIWLGGLSVHGYAIGKPEGVHVRIHRWLYKKLRGDIGDLVLDHICRVRCCINPDHLEPVTVRENVIRGFGVTAANAKMKVCKYGHPFDKEVKYSNGKTKRCCSLCRQVRDRKAKRNSKLRSASV